MHAHHKRKQHRKDNRRIKTRIVVPNRIARSRGEVPILVGREGLDAGGPDDVDGFGGEGEMAVGDAVEDDVLGGEECAVCGEGWGGEEGGGGVVAGDEGLGWW